MWSCCLVCIGAIFNPVAAQRWQAAHPLDGWQTICSHLRFCAPKKQWTQNTFHVEKGTALSLSEPCRLHCPKWTPAAERELTDHFCGAQAPPLILKMWTYSVTWVKYLQLTLTSPYGSGSNGECKGCWVYRKIGFLLYVCSTTSKFVLFSWKKKKSSNREQG